MQRLLYILLLFAAAGARAQQMPERRDVRQGNQLYDRSDYLGAAERYTQALDKDPACYEALYNLGNAFSKAGMHEKAERTITRAAADTLRTDADRAQAFYNLGNTQFQQKKYKEALESYRRSLLLDPDDMEARYNFAYTKKLLEQQQDDDNNGGGKGNGGEGGGQNDNNQNNDDEQQQDENQDPENDEQQPGDNGEEDRDETPQDESSDGSSPDPEDETSDDGRPLPDGLSEQEAEQMLDAIQAQEDRTQEKLKEKQGRVVRGRKNW